MRLCQSLNLPHERSWTWRGSHGSSSTPRYASCGSAVAAQRSCNKFKKQLLPGSFDGLEELNFYTTASVFPREGPVLPERVVSCSEPFYLIRFNHFILPSPSCIRPKDPSIDGLAKRRLRPCEVSGFGAGRRRGGAKEAGGWERPWAQRGRAWGEFWPRRHEIPEVLAARGCSRSSASSLRPGLVKQTIASWRQRASPGSIGSELWCRALKFGPGQVLLWGVGWMPRSNNGKCWISRCISTSRCRSIRK